ncbi:MAG: T9SS type A sorting domain-containing protein [Candidatus Kapabacteria bacterium]|nr:T9SS type A sorting domain-containing protein [Candidatus Kapabacteria bacterium]
MKNFYLLFVFAILLPLSIFARPIDKTFLSPHQPDHYLDLGNFGISPSDVIKVKIGDYPEPQMAFKLLQDSVEFFFSSLWADVTPFTYEPKSNTLIYVTTDRESVGGWANGYVFLHFSNDGGQNWTKQQVFFEEKRMCFFPSIAVLNPNNETDPSKFKYVITITPYVPKPTPNDTLYWPEGNKYLFYNGTGWANVESFPEKAPVQNNVGGVQQWMWNNKQSFSVSSPKGDFFYVYSMLSPLEGYQYGYYGLSYIDFTGGTLDPQSKVPAEWGVNQFRTPEGLNSTPNAPLRMGADKNGDIYAFVFNMFADNQDKRIGAFSKSVDNGKNWSQFSRMPDAVIDDYLALWGHNPEFNKYVYPFTTWASVVTGPDEFSLFLRLYSWVGTTAENAVGTGHYVEAQYKNGTWQPLRRIAELNINPLRIANVAASGAPTKDSLQTNPRYQEIQAAITADGNSIVFKWLDTPSEYNTAKLISPVTLVGSMPTTIIDSLAATDIFIGYRHLNSDTWVNYNITQDKWYNKGTFIPEIVPSLSQIPVAEHVTTAFPPTSARISYPYFLQNIVADRGFSNLITSVFDANNPVPVKNPAIQDPKGLDDPSSILEQLPFSLKDVSPNPADNFTEVKFNLDFDANVSLKIHNPMGQVVKEVYSGQAQAGQNTINVITSDLPAGAYFYSISVNGKSQTKLLNVVR